MRPDRLVASTLESPRASCVQARASRGSEPCDTGAGTPADALESATFRVCDQPVRIGRRRARRSLSRGGGAGTAPWARSSAAASAGAGTARLTASSSRLLNPRLRSLAMRSSSLGSRSRSSGGVRSSECPAGRGLRERTTQHRNHSGLGRSPPVRRSMTLPLHRRRRRDGVPAAAVLADLLFLFEGR